MTTYHDLFHASYFTHLRTDGSSFSDPEGVPGGGPGPADDIIPAGRVYCYSSDEEDKEAAVPLHQRIKRSRFVSRIQEERIHIHETARSDNNKLDMEQFQPMMTSETVSDPASVARMVTSLGPRVTRAKRECQAEAECYDDTTRYLRKREKRERRQEAAGRASDYGSLSTLGSSLHKLDLIEQDPKSEVIIKL